MRVIAVICGLLLVIAGGGCEPVPPAQPAANVPPVPALPTAAQPPAPAAPAPAPPATETVVAEVGVGQKGRSLDEYSGMVVEPVKSLFATRERVVFEITIPKNLQLFQANEGRLPKSHEEFMQRIIKEGMVTLPDLPEGARYKWDPQLGELMVERPVKKAMP